MDTIKDISGLEIRVIDNTITCCYLYIVYPSCFNAIVDHVCVELTHLAIVNHAFIEDIHVEMEYSIILSLPINSFMYIYIRIHSVTKVIITYVIIS